MTIASPDVLLVVLRLFWVLFLGAQPCWHSSPHPAPRLPRAQIPITELLFLCHKGVI